MSSCVYLSALGVPVLFSGCIALDRFYTRENGASQLELSRTIEGKIYTFAGAISESVIASASAPASAPWELTSA